MSPAVLDRIPAGRPVSVERETFPGLLRDGVRLEVASSMPLRGRPRRAAQTKG